MDTSVLLLAPVIETVGRNHPVISWTADTNEGGQDREGGTAGTEPEVSQTRPRESLQRLRRGEEVVQCGVL